VIHERTYSIAEPPCPAMAWEEYERRVSADWTAVLNSPEGEDEATIQSFLERHPCLLPGAFSMTGKSGHFPLGMMALAQVPIEGLSRKVPDFIWLAKDSGAFTPVLVEIESPAKKWFTKSGQPTHQLTQAMQQISDWKSWLNQPENVLTFFRAFDIPNWVRNELTFRPEFVLIYGRRAEFDETPSNIRKRDAFEQHGQVV